MATKTLQSKVFKTTGSSPNYPYNNNGLYYGGLQGVDQSTSNSVQDFIKTAGDGKIELPANLQDRLAARYQAFDFQKPDYNPNIQSVADLPDNIKDAMFERNRQSIGRTAESQRIKGTEQFQRMGRRGGSGLTAVLRDANKNEMEQVGNATTQAMTDEGNRRFEEAKTMRGLNLEDERFRLGLDDMLQTRRAAEAEKVYQSEYGRQQDQINTVMNQAAFNSGERANQASRQQAAIQQGSNYLGQGTAYRLNTQQLNNKKPVNPNIVGTGTGPVNQQPQQYQTNYNSYSPSNMYGGKAPLTPNYNNQNPYGAQQ